MLRCVICTGAFVQDIIRTEINCNQCSEKVIKCPRCKNKKINTCFNHTKREHICLSKCLHECILTIQPKIKKRKVIKKREINIKHQPKVKF